MGFFVVIIFFAIAISIAQKQAQTKTWQAVGKQTGLAVTSGSFFRAPAMSGTVRGVQVRAEVVSRGSGDNRSSVTRYTVTYPRRGPEITFRRQGAMSFLRQLVGGQDLVTGDPRFDDSVIIDGHDPSTLQEYLTPARRAAILAIFSTWPQATISPSSIVVETHRVERNQDRMMATLNRLVDSGRLLAAPERADEALAPLEAGDMTSAVAALHEVNEAEAQPNVVTQLIEAESLVALGRAAEAAPILDAAATVLPGDAEVKGWRAVAEGPAPPPPAPSGADAGPVIQQDAMDDLFGGDRFGHEVEAAFDATYAGRHVRWTGEVENSRSYRSDRDFGDVPGTKTTVRLGVVGSNGLMSNRIKAVVDLPDGTELARTDRIEFTGRLLRIDRFTRMFYVADAALVGPETTKPQSAAD